MKLNPEDHFKPTRSSVASILASYSLQLHGFEPARSGIENCTVLVETDKGTRVLRVYRYQKKSRSEIDREAAFVDYLNQKGIPVAVPIANALGQTLTEFNEGEKTWQAVLMPFMAGAHARSYTNSLIYSLATVQARMHLLSRDFGFEEDKPLGVSELKEGYFIKLIKNRDSLEPAAREFVERAENYVVRLDPALPSGLCHLDYDNGNVLSHKGRVTAVLDFDDLEYAPFARCLAYSLWDVTYDKGVAGLQKYLAAYELLHPLSISEKTVLMPIVLFRHYVIGCKDIADGQMNKSLLVKYLDLENVIKATRLI